MNNRSMRNRSSPVNLNSNHHHHHWQHSNNSGVNGNSSTHNQSSSNRQQTITINDTPSPSVTVITISDSEDDVAPKWYEYFTTFYVRLVMNIDFEFVNSPTVFRNQYPCFITKIRINLTTRERTSSLA